MKEKQTAGKLSRLNEDLGNMRRNVPGILIPFFLVLIGSLFPFHRNLLINALSPIATIILSLWVAGQFLGSRKSLASGAARLFCIGFGFFLVWYGHTLVTSYLAKQCVLDRRVAGGFRYFCYDYQCRYEGWAAGHPTRYEYCFVAANGWYTVAVFEEAGRVWAYPKG